MKILFIVLLLMLLIGFVKLNFNVRYCEKKGFEAVLKVVFFKFFLYTKNKKKNLKKKELKTKKDNKKEKQKKQKIKRKQKKKKDIFEILELIKILLRPVPRFLRFLNRGFRINIIRFKAIIAKQEAKDTALLYSEICKIFYNVLGVVGNYCCIVRKDIDISLDFINNKTKVSFDLKFSITVGRIIVGVLIYLFFVLCGFVTIRFFNNKRSGLDESSN